MATIPRVSIGDCEMRWCTTLWVMRCGAPLSSASRLLVDLLVAHLRGDVAFGTGMDWRAAPRVGDGDDRLLLRVLDLNQRGPILGNMAAVSNDECHRFADIGHPPVGQRGYLDLGRDEEKAHHVDLEAGQVLLGVDRHVRRELRAPPRF